MRPPSSGCGSPSREPSRLETGDDGGELGHRCGVATIFATGVPRQGTVRGHDTGELKAEIAAGDIDTVLLALTDMQGRLQGKRLTAPHFLEAVAGHGAEACNYLLAVDVEMNTVDGYAMSSWERGYGDFVMKPDLDTLAPAWHEGTAMCLADLEWEDGSPVVASPRQILRAQLERLAERGWEAHAGTELEFIIFDDTYEEAWDNGYRELSRPTSTTSTTRCWAPRASSRCCAGSATR